MTTHKKPVIARNEAISQLFGFVAAQLAARSVERRHPDLPKGEKDREVIVTVEMLHCVQHDNSSKPSLMTVTTQSGKQESRKAVIPKIFSLGSEKPLDTSFRWYDDTTKFAVHLKLTT